jgi:hypothetical protein
MYFDRAVQREIWQVVILGRVLINWFCNRGSLNVRFAPKATELLRRRELTRCANS